MNTFLGISTDLDPDHLDRQLIADSAVLYLEGYLFDRPEAKLAFKAASEHAALKGRKVALTLSDGFCVDRHRDEFLDLIRNNVDILFANEHEIKSLYQTGDFDSAAAQARLDSKLAVLTRSAKGSEIFAHGEVYSIAPDPVEAVIDTTGAGDLYAAGFLYGYARQLPLEICGKLASMAAAEVISHIGARPAQPLSQLARDRGLLS